MFFFQNGESGDRTNLGEQLPHLLQLLPVPIGLPQHNRALCAPQGGEHDIMKDIQDCYVHLETTYHEYISCKHIIEP